MYQCGTQWTIVKFTWDFTSICRTAKLVKIGQKYRALYMLISVGFTAAGDVNP